MVEFAFEAGQIVAARSREIKSCSFVEIGFIIAKPSLVTAKVAVVKLA